MSAAHCAMDMPVSCTMSSWAGGWGHPAAAAHGWHSCIFRVKIPCRVTHGWSRSHAPLARRRLLAAAGAAPQAQPPAISAVGSAPLEAPQGPGVGDFAPQPAVLMGVKVEDVPQQVRAL